MLLLTVGSFIAAALGSPPKFCSLGDACDSCTISTPLSGKCADDNKKHLFQFCNPRTKKIDVDPSSYLFCSEGVYRQQQCSDDGRTHFSATSLECVDPALLTFHAQGTSGSGRVGDVCTFNTDCLGGMYCAVGQCRCLSTYIAVDSYCYERIPPSESGCFYDVQCSAVWPDAYCKSGQCQCPSDDMVAVKTRDGTLCLWTSTSEPSCPLPSLPPPDSAAALVVLPAPSAKNTVSIASCNPQASTLPLTEEILLASAHEHKCAVRGSLEDPIPKDVSDLYDCIDNSVFWQAQGLDASRHPIGVCCMNRAFTCQQPKKGESHALGSVPRWWYNGVTGSCQQFLFDPQAAEVSPNNFETLNHCESFCKDTCPRGNPAYLNSKTDVNQSPHIGCSLTQPCPEPFKCMEVASQNLCCPSRKTICNEAGGRAKDPFRSTPYDPGMRFDQLTGEQANYAIGISTRYYYNPIDGQCHPFTYNGFLGNFNNFPTQSDCQMFCSRLQCTHGNPLTNGHGAPQRCQRDIDCPSTHVCAAEHSVCCPTPQTLCTEPLRVGDCKQSIRQFWYNAETRSCESFLYTGCQGNNNRFHSINECQSHCKNINAEPECPQGRAYIDYSGKFLQCGESNGRNSCPVNYECHFDGHVHGCCPSKAFTCSLQLNKGVSCGSGSSYRYYYNTQLKECQSFLFHGCDGNSNNFATAEKCQSYCEIAGCPNGGLPLRINNLVQSCSSTDPCPIGYECSQIDGTGVAHRRCCPTKASICAKPPQMGMLPKCGTSTGQTRYYFNFALKTCSPYMSNGCDTSLNSFKSILECEDFCLSAGCKAGDAVYKDPNTNRPFLCNTALQNNCPLNYQCTLNSLTQEHVCCGSDNMGVCPAGEKAFIEPHTLTPRQCAMVADGKCPPGYLCRFSQTNHKYYCCGSLSGSLCPAGRALYRSAVTQTPVQCAMGPIGGGCPATFTCQSDVPNAFQGYCCSQMLICPGGVDFHLDEKTMLPTTCTSEGFAFCPQGYSCQQQPETTKLFCCLGKEKEGVKDGCPPTQYAYVDENSKIKSCDPFNVNGTDCPMHYSCQWSITNQKYQCCGSHVIRQTKPEKMDDGCPRKQFALLDRWTSRPRICTAGEQNACPTGFFCQFSAKYAQFQCCGQSGGCPARRAAFIAIDGNAQECMPGPDMCADGFECVRSAYDNRKNICCSKEDNECRENEKMIQGKCVILKKIGDTCGDDDECAGGSRCRDHFCMCAFDEEVVNGECIAQTCEPTQIILDGKCLDRAAFGEPCRSSLQCLSNLRCVNGQCDCGKGERVEGNNCIKNEEGSSGEIMKARPKNIDICPLRSEQAYFEKGTKKVRYCSQTANDCPKHYTCQYSEVVKQNVCCGKKDKKEETIKKEETLTVASTESPRTSTTQSLRKTTTVTASPIIPISLSHCPPSMTPYLLNGTPKTCSSSLCPYGFECKFSPKNKDYFCCSKIWRRTDHLQKDGGCEQGSVLLYPATQEPVQCDLKRRACPHGFLCLPHTRTKALQCCSVQSDKDTSHSEPDSGSLMEFSQNVTENSLVECPNYMVRVNGIRQGRKTSYCARSCPEGQMAFNGICQ